MGFDIAAPVETSVTQLQMPHKDISQEPLLNFLRGISWTYKTKE